jgi:hypothetical protein
MRDTPPSDQIQSPSSPMFEPFLNAPPSPILTTKNSFWEKSSSAGSLQYCSSSNSSYQSSGFQFPPREAFMDLVPVDEQSPSSIPRSNQLSLNGESRQPQRIASFKKSSFMRKFTHRLVRSMSIHHGEDDVNAGGLETPTKLENLQSAESQLYYTITQYFYVPLFVIVTFIYN